MGTAEIHQFLTHLAVVVRLIYGSGYSPSSIAGETDKLAPRDGTT